MIGHFAWLYPDETVQCGIARSTGRTEDPSKKSAVKSLFGRTTITAVTDLPSHLNLLVESMPVSNSDDAASLVDEHTLWPILTAFQPTERRMRSRSDMMEHGQTYLNLGLMATGCPFPRWLRFCPICSARDRVRFGETYWHRVHQVPGINVCAHHSVRLVSSKVSYRHSRNRHDFRPADEVIGMELCVGEPLEGIEADLAVDAYWILLHPEFAMPASELRGHFIRALRERGWATYSGRIRMRAVKSAFRATYSQDVLSRFACLLPDYGETWLERMLRPHDGCQHPIRYLLVARFVGLRLQDVVNTETVDHPFGRAPWPCLNKASDHFNSSTIPSCEITVTRNGRSLLGSFHCNQCGMVYERIGPDRRLVDRLRRHRIPRYGPVWEQRLCEWWRISDLSLRALAKRLGVDPRTLCRQAGRMGLPLYRPGRQAVQVSLPTNASAGRPARYAAAAKQEWLALRSELPAAHTSQLRIARPDLYAFLQRHESAWLHQNSPERARPKQSSRVDWSERDHRIANEVEAAAVRLKECNPPVRLTATALLREAGFIWVVGKKLKSMMTTQLVLSRHVESRRDFALRRIEAVVARFSEQSEPLPYWSLVRSAGLRPDLLRDQKIQDKMRALILERSLGSQSEAASLHDPFESQVVSDN